MALTASEADSTSRSSTDVILGNVVLFFQCFGMGALLVFQKPLNYPPPLITLYFYACGTVLTLLLALYYVIWDISAWNVGTSLSFWGALAYTAVFSTAYSYVVYAYTVKVLNSTLTSLYSALQPVATLGLSLIFLGTTVNIYEIIAGVLVIAGLLLTTTARMKEQRSETQALISPTSEDGPTESPT